MNALPSMRKCTGAPGVVLGDKGHIFLLFCLPCTFPASFAFTPWAQIFRIGG
jgi:hypothetical protein